MQPTTEFGRRLVEAMAEEKISQGELERRAGFTSRGYVSRLKGDRGKRPSQDVVARVATILRVRPEWLASGEGPKRLDNRGEAPRERAVSTAREYGVLEEAIAHVLSAYSRAEFDEMSGLWWLERILAANTEVRLRLAETSEITAVHRRRRAGRRELAERVAEQQAKALAAKRGGRIAG